MVTEFDVTGEESNVDVAPPGEQIALVDFDRDNLVTLDLQSGTYMFACFLQVADGTPHFLKGMVKEVVIT